MSLTNSHSTQLCPLPDVNTCKFQPYADWSVPQGGSPQPGSLQRLGSVCDLSCLGKTPSLSACPRCATCRCSSRNRLSEGGGQPRAARPQPALQVPATHTSRCHLTLLSATVLNTGFSWQGFMGEAPCATSLLPSLQHRRPKA